MTKDQEEIEQLRDFYDDVYYAKPDARHGKITWHHRLVARRLGSMDGKRVLDVACGLGQWLELLHAQGAEVSGVDISERAIDACKVLLPARDFRVAPAEPLPFEDGRFDLVTCMGSLEHFPDKPAALREMLRVAKPDAKFLILVPNAGFLPARFGLFGGTWQKRIREDVYSLDEWRRLFESAGMEVEARWRDLHLLDSEWLGKGRPFSWPGRLLLGLLLPFWPIAWQYQVHHVCTRRNYEP